MSMKKSQNKKKGSLKPQEPEIVKGSNIPELPEEGKKHTKIGIHTVSQFYGDNKQLSLFSDEKIDAFSKATGISLLNRPDSYGVVLNQSQRRVLEGILKAFSDTNYSGDELIDKTTYSSQIYSINKIQGAYSNIDKMPVIKLT